MDDLLIGYSNHVIVVVEFRAHWINLVLVVLLVFASLVHGIGIELNETLTVYPKDIILDDT